MHCKKLDDHLERFFNRINLLTASLQDIVSREDYG